MYKIKYTSVFDHIYDIHMSSKMVFPNKRMLSEYINFYIFPCISLLYKYLYTFMANVVILLSVISVI